MTHSIFVGEESKGPSPTLAHVKVGDIFKFKASAGMESYYMRIFSTRERETKIVDLMEPRLTYRYDKDSSALARPVEILAPGTHLTIVVGG